MWLGPQTLSAGFALSVKSLLTKGLLIEVEAAELDPYDP
jgi:hypothetical protein